MVSLESNLEHTGQQAGKSLDGMPDYHRTHTHTQWALYRHRSTLKALLGPGVIPRRAIIHTQRPTFPVANDMCRIHVWQGPISVQLGSASPLPHPYTLALDKRRKPQKRPIQICVEHAKYIEDVRGKTFLPHKITDLNSPCSQACSSQAVKVQVWTPIQIFFSHPIPWNLWRRTPLPSRRNLPRGTYRTPTKFLATGLA